jgi:MFS family permease
MHLTGLGRFGRHRFASNIVQGAVNSEHRTRPSGHTNRGLAVGGYVAFSLAMFSARLVGDRLRARFNAVVLLRSSGMSAAIGMALALVAPSPVLAIVGFGLTGFGLANVVPVLFTAAGNTPGVPAATAATAVAAAAAVGYAGFLAGPPLIGVLAGAFSLRGALVLVVVLALLIAVFSGIFKQNRVADVAPTP